MNGIFLIGVDITKVSINEDKGYISFILETDEDDISHLSSSKISLAKNEAKIKIGDVKLDEIHPDLIGLATILMCHQFIGKRLVLPVEVSPKFLEGANSVLSKYKITSKSNENISANKPPVRSRPGLAYSGGADSCAALAVMPGNTVPIFMHRPMSKDSIYDSEAPLRSCEELKEVGYDVKVIECDLEYLRKPIGFPSDLANAVPAVLLSQSLGLDSIAFGTVLESAYGIGHEKYIDYGNGSHWRFYGKLFSSAGIDLCLPVAGVSEVGTSIIGNLSPFGEFSQSCIRGKWNKPCLKCWKCFRKELLAISLDSNKKVDLKKIMENSEVQIRLSAYPISHENVIIYSIQNIDINNFPVLKIVRNRIDMSTKLDFLRKWYSPSLTFIPEKWRTNIRNKILKYLEIMDKEDEEILLNWNMYPFLESESTKKSHSKLTSFWQDL